MLFHGVRGGVASKWNVVVKARSAQMESQSMYLGGHCVTEYGRRCEYVFEVGGVWILDAEKEWLWSWRQGEWLGCCDRGELSFLRHHGSAITGSLSFRICSVVWVITVC